MDFIFDNSYTKPIKVVYDGYPCPKNPSIYCNYSMFKHEGMDIFIYCSQEHCKFEEELI